MAYPQLLGEPGRTKKAAWTITKVPNKRKCYGRVVKISLISYMRLLIKDQERWLVYLIHRKSTQRVKKNNETDEYVPNKRTR